MKINIMYNYNLHIRKPLEKKKEKDIFKILKRMDYDQALALKGMTDKHMNDLKIMTFRKIQAKRNHNLEEYLLSKILNDQVDYLEAKVGRFIASQESLINSYVQAVFLSPEFQYQV